MAPVLWVLAVLSTITIIHRIAYTYQQTRILDAKAAEEAAAAEGQQQPSIANKAQGGKRPQEAASFN